ncbi:hypothetical protein DFJ74DRAFT_682765 [Hyaloraphidium curvatum]|nr:hypothetical protein DFJ74DRAFT_682765 [Hyaloraphidium curvatum]
MPQHSIKHLAIPELFNVKGKIALVTGGGTGIGKMIAAALVSNGAKVYIASRKMDVVQKAAEDLNRLGKGQCIALQADLVTRADCEKLAGEIKKREDRLHILVNNAGISWGGKLEDFDEKNGWDKLFALNVKSIWYLTVSCLDLLSKGARGNEDPARMFAVSSMGGVTVNSDEGSALSAPGNAPFSYAVSKAAVNHLVRQLANVLAKRHIMCNTIAPGVFPSRMTAYGIEHNERVFIENQPSGRIGMVEDMAGLALFLSSKASAHITADVFGIDGGASLGVMGKRGTEAKL